VRVSLPHIVVKPSLAYSPRLLNPCSEGFTSANLSEALLPAILKCPFIENCLLYTGLLVRVSLPNIVVKPSLAYSHRLLTPGSEGFTSADLSEALTTCNPQVSFY
jgi:hypothetical protein